MSYIPLRRKREAENIFLEEVIERFNNIDKDSKSIGVYTFFLLK